MILDGKAVAAEMRLNLKERVARQARNGARNPNLSIIQVGDNPASNTYIKHKQNDCTEIGIDCTLFRIPGSATYIADRVIDLIHELNSTKTVDGIIVQLPIEGLNSEYYQTKIVGSIAPGKDVDGLRPDVFAALTNPFYTTTSFYPCTPHGIIMLLDHYKIPLEDAGVTIVGRSKLVGLPLSLMMTNRDANVTLLHSKTNEDVIWQEMRQSYIVVSAVGKPHIWEASDFLNVNERQVVIDVGTTMVDGKLRGDFCWNYLKDFGKMENFDYTPVPGGVGPMTRVALMDHIVTAYEYHLKEKGQYQHEK